MGIAENSRSGFDNTGDGLRDIERDTAAWVKDAHRERNPDDIERLGSEHLKDVRKIGAPALSEVELPDDSEL